jgi:hypothetical protein
MALDDVPRCQHVKMNGTQCGSPALRRRRHCFFHERIRREQARIRADASALHAFDLPLLEDANSVQMALMKVIQMLGSGRLDHKTAGLMLYALQTASINLRHASFEADDATEVVIDRNDVHRTCIGGQQWFEEDFEGRSGPAQEAADESVEEETDEQESDEEEAGEEEADEEVQAAGADRNPRAVTDLRPPPLSTGRDSPTQSQESPRSER